MNLNQPLISANRPQTPLDGDNLPVLSESIAVRTDVRSRVRGDAVPCESVLSTPDDASLFTRGNIVQVFIFNRKFYKVKELKSLMLFRVTFNLRVLLSRDPLASFFIYIVKSF